MVLDSTAMTWAIAELLADDAGRVTVWNPMRTRSIASANVKTDTMVADVLAQLGAADFLPEVWAPDRVTRALRRRIARRSSLVRQRTWLRNQVHAGAHSDRGAGERRVRPGRAALAGRASRLPAHEREQLDSHLRAHDALDRVEIDEGQLARQALAPPDVRHLMTIPGDGAITAPALAAVIGDVTASPARGSWSATPAWIRACANRASARRGTVTSPGPVRRRRAGCWSWPRTVAICTPGLLRAFQAP